MSRIKGISSSAALIVAVVALVSALGGGAVAGVAVTSLNKKQEKAVKKIAKRVSKRSGLGKKERRKARKIAANEANKAVASAGPKLFAYVSDRLFPPSDTDAVVEFGKGVVDVEDFGGSTYRVRFAQSITGCAVLATPGLGAPVGPGDPYGGAYGVNVEVDPTPPHDAVYLSFLNSADATTESSFMVSVLC